MTRILDLLMVAGTAVLSVRLFTIELDRRYRVFFFYLIFETLRNGLLAGLGSSSGAYQKIWVLTEPIDWVLYVLVVLEIYALVLADYRGLSTAGRWALIASVAIALLASGLTLIAPSQYTAQGPLMRYYYVADRAVYFSLVVFLISILLFLMQYPIVLSRNIVVHSMVFSVYFLGNTVIYLILTMRGRAALPGVSLALSGVTVAALGAWLVLLNRAGEIRKVSLRPHWMPGKEEELVSQLNHLNAALLRVTRK